MSIADNIKFDEKGLVPAVVQHHVTNKILMTAYMNKESLEKTLETKKACFFSRSRQSLWLKGETSGNYMNVEDIYVDCDADCLVLKVRPDGPACHTGNETCFYRAVVDGEIKEYSSNADASVLTDIYNTAADRKANPAEGSYTTYLFNKGLDKILKKVGEETSEVIIGAKNEGGEEACYEICDLLYHLSVLMVEKGISWEDVYTELSSRYGKKATNKNAYR